GKSRNLQAADVGKGTARCAAVLCGISLTDFFDWKGRSAVVSSHPPINQTNPAGICTTIPNSSFLIPN
ncbi:MAG: hypothetical protein IJH03_05560, partial [Clostridia bacterium]|nr:hypothetical protein [Clostridia bacterium]